MASVTHIAEKVAAATGMTQKASKEAVVATLTVMKELGEEGTLMAPPLGKFKMKHREARTARNPQTGAEIQVPEKDVLTFKPYVEKEEKVPAAKGKKAPAKAASKPAAKAAAPARRGRR